MQRRTPLSELRNCWKTASLSCCFMFPCSFSSFTLLSRPVGFTSALFSTVSCPTSSLASSVISWFSSDKIVSAELFSFSPHKMISRNFV